ncbi:BCL2 modifying factor 2 isoform X1 [Girardinichthys multiradiatus]|uniref:BCL2 modifying factor 2 isoform X1 n=2 Tax=Girardinichthys multiradiatus TaxID=208333 RepID=UPI001FAE386E|nr:BCL2 modifying factor 2 isoform X1 [Girardinichthys multiradiatus]
MAGGRKRFKNWIYMRVIIAKRPVVMDGEHGHKVTGSLPLRHWMDDEEEDMSLPISQLMVLPFGDIKYEDRATQITAGQALAAVTAAVATSQGHNNNGINALSCSIHLQPHVPFNGNAGLPLHLPAQFVPMEDRGERQVAEEEDRGEEDDRMEQRPEVEPMGVSVEVQLGRKLREIGDKFHQDHVEVFMRHQRQNLPAWMRLTIALFGFLFPREVLVPRLREAQR